MRSFFWKAKYRKWEGKRKSYNLDVARKPSKKNAFLLAMSIRRTAHLSLPRSRKNRLKSKPKDTSLFIWTIVILLLVGFTIFCWIGSIYVFGHPEKAFNYTLLLKAKKIDPLKKFEITTAPRGEFLEAETIYERFASLRPLELAQTNAELLRNYVRNYKQTMDKVPYLSGTYTILQVYPLEKNNVFPEGVVALARSNDHPNVLLEHAFPASSESEPHLLRMLQPGFELKFEKQPNRAIDISSIIHVEQMPNGQIKVTGVPLVYGTYTSTASDGPGSFSLLPPDKLNLSAGPPLISAATMEKTLSPSTSPGQKDTSLHRSLLVQNDDTTKKTSDEFIRVAPAQPAKGGPRPPAPPPVFERTGELPIRRAIAANGIPMLSPDGETVLVSPEPPVAEAVSPSPPPKALPVVTSTGRNWQTFAPGQAPSGRSANAQDVTAMADRGIGGERIYLNGDFVVRVSGNNRAVLRTHSADGKESNLRVIVDYPYGANLPKQGDLLTRGADRPLLITNVQKAPDGTINVFALEIIKP